MDELLTIEELSVILKVPKSWIYSRTCRKELPHVKIGRHLRFQKPMVFKALGITDIDITTKAVIDYVNIR